MSRRTERINHQLRREVSDLLRRTTKDPRLAGFLTITRVSISADLSHAEVFYSVLGNEDLATRAQAGLEAARGFLRHELRGRLSLRQTPELSFHHDNSMAEAARVLDLLREVTEEVDQTIPSPE